MGNNAPGFTVIGVTLLLAAAAIAATAVLFSQFLFLTQSREGITRAKIQMLVEAVRGNPESDTWGYLGDMGLLPQSLDNLVTKPKVRSGCPGAGNPAPDFDTNNTFGVGMGWRGPYIVDDGSGFTDDWGNNLIYEVITESAPVVNGTAQRFARITSVGPNGVSGGGDDIVSEPIFETGILQVDLQVGQSNVIPPSISGSLFYSCDGNEAGPLPSTTVNFPGGSGEKDFLEFPPTHHGPHHLKVQQGQALIERSVVDLFGGDVLRTDTTPSQLVFSRTNVFQVIPAGVSVTGKGK